MSAVTNFVEDTFDFVGDVFESVGDAIEDVAGVAFDIVEGVGNVVGDVVEGALNDPVGTIAKVAAVATGNAWALPYISAGSVIVNGGDLGDAILAGGLTYAVQGAVNYVGGADAAVPGDFDYGPSIPNPVPEVDLSTPYVPPYEPPAAPVAPVNSEISIPSGDGDFMGGGIGGGVGGAGGYQGGTDYTVGPIDTPTFGGNLGDTTGIDTGPVIPDTGSNPVYDFGGNTGSVIPDTGSYTPPTTGGTVTVDTSGGTVTTGGTTTPTTGGTGDGTFSTNPSDYVSDAPSVSVDSSGTVTHTPGSFGETVPDTVVNTLPPGTSVMQVPGTDTYQTINNDGITNIVNNQGQTILNNDQIVSGTRVVSSNDYTRLGITPVDSSTIAPGTSVIVGTGGVSVTVAGESATNSLFVQTSDGAVIRVQNATVNGPITNGTVLNYDPATGFTDTSLSVASTPINTTPLPITGGIGIGTANPNAPVTGQPAFGGESSGGDPFGVIPAAFRIAKDQIDVAIEAYNLCKDEESEITDPNFKSLKLKNENLKDEKLKNKNRFEWKQEDMLDNVLDSDNYEESDNETDNENSDNENSDNEEFNEEFVASKQTILSFIIYNHSKASFINH
jgi:hypothetical protein